jgi:hypothetical protein
MAFVYNVLGGRALDWVVLSFRAVLHGDPELEQAQVDGQTVLPGDVFRFEVYERLQSTRSPHDFRRRRIPITNKHYFLVDPANHRVLRRPADQLRWRRAEVP